MVVAGARAQGQGECGPKGIELQLCKMGVSWDSTARAYR